LIAACGEHLEWAIDEFIYKYLISPDIFSRAQVEAAGEKMPDRCGCCGESAEYLVREYAD